MQTMSEQGINIQWQDCENLNHSLQAAMKSGVVEVPGVLLCALSRVLWGQKNQGTLVCYPPTVGRSTTDLFERELP